MKEHSVEMKIPVRAPASVIWGALADTRRWPTWSPNDAASLEREGVSDPDGVGAIRVLRTGRITVREEIMVFEPERREVYRLLSGLPVRDYEGEVVLSPSAGNEGVTDLVWRARWKPKRSLMGGLQKLMLQKTVDRWGGALATHAEQVARRT
jgi:hypothetical protein